MDTYTNDFYGVTEYLGGFPSENEVVRARHVIIQHAKYTFGSSQCWSDGRNRRLKTFWNKDTLFYAWARMESVHPGEYRTGRVIVPYSPNYQRRWEFVRPQSVPVYMKALVSRFNAVMCLSTFISLRTAMAGCAVCFLT